jgi:hypothetical protein
LSSLPTLSLSSLSALSKAGSALSVMVDSVGHGLVQEADQNDEHANLETSVNDVTILFLFNFTQKSIANYFDFKN